MSKPEDTLSGMRHSLAHLLASAVKQLWPGAQNAIGPSIDNGFYQDFDMGQHKISDDDLSKIENKMREILKTWGPFVVKEVSVEQAKKDFADNTYKLELIEDFAKEGKKITENDPGNFLDLCKGGHAADPQKDMQHFKLLSLAGAYWRGDVKNKMLTRIYGTAFPRKKELDDHLNMLDEAKKRDHRKLGEELELFTFSKMVGKGLPLWLERGAILRRVLEQFITDEELKRGYKHVITPDIASLELYKTSGHYPYYKDSMYAPIKIDDEEFMLRPMTCPHHFQIYLSKPRTYRELPMRIAELGKLYRYEKSGELSGLTRVRSFTLADSHIICTSDQMKDEITGALDLIEYCANVFGLKKGEDYRYRLSLGDRGDESKYFKDDAAWDKAEDVLREVLTERKDPFFEAEAEAAFYGPKIDVQMKNVLGKEDTAFTVQYDFVMSKRFGLTYADSNGNKQEAVVVHRSSIGAVERVIAFLIEHYAGRFPVWLAPEQIRIITLNQDQTIVDFAQTMADQAKKLGLRVQVDADNESVGKKIRNAELMKIPYTVVIGPKEVETNEIIPRVRKDMEVEAAHPPRTPYELVKTVANEAKMRVHKTSL